MEVIDVDGDYSDDDDIFVLNQVKPINNLTVPEALLIKHNVIHSLKLRNTCTVKSNRRKSHQKIKEKKSPRLKIPLEMKTNKTLDGVQKHLTKGKNNVGFNNIIAKELNFLTGVTIGCDESSSKQQINLTSEMEIEIDSSKSACYSKSVLDDGINAIEKPEVPNETNNKVNIKLSPSIIRRQKKFKIDENSGMSSSPKKYSRRKEFSPKSIVKETSSVSEMPFNSSNTINLKSEDLQDVEIKKESLSEDFFPVEFKEKFGDNGELLCFLLKKIISDVTQRQIDLENNQTSADKIMEKLFSVDECNILEQFCKLSEVNCKVFVRLLCRSKVWYRLQSISFKDITMPLNGIFEYLREIKFVDTNIAKEDLQFQMSLLNKGEVQKLCKMFTSVKLNSSSKKSQLITSLIECTKSQKTVINMFQKGNNSSSLATKLQAEVSKYLGTCVTVSETVKATFNKVIILFSYPHYFEEEEKRLRSQLYMCLNVQKSYIKFCDYKLSPALVFETCEDFNTYSEALTLQEEFINAVNLKKYEEFLSITQKAKEEFKKLLINDKFIERYNRLMPFLRRFSGGHIYAKLLTKFCLKFKTKSNVKDIIGVVQMLLAQNLFLLSKRGKWYEILSQSLESTKENKAAAEILIEAQKDPNVDEVQKLVLQLRGQALLRKKTSGIENFIKEILDEVCTISIQEPPSIVITGKALEGSKSGFKAVYIEKTDSGKMYTSVEERALLHYKTKDFPHGCHVEGYIVQSLYALLFFDIIYGYSPAGVFLSSYQEAPLDLYTKYFYINRKSALDHRLTEMPKWTQKEAEERLKSAYYKNVNTSCIISWKEHFTAELFCEIMNCITLPVLAKICRKFVLNYRVAKPGFPDLTLWNPETKKCKFVEVKSPNDKLSSGQRIWLAYLREIGADCEVCNVKNISRQLVM